MKRFVVVLSTWTMGVALLGVASPVDASAQVPAVTPAVSAAGGFTSMPPNRLLDTREGIGAPKGALVAHGTVHLQVTGRGGVPVSKVSAVVLNVTVTAPTAVGFVTVFGADPRPTASNLNFVKAQTVPNLVIAPVRPDGTVDLYNGSTGTTQLIADVSGYYLAGDPTVDGTFGSLAPNRLLDTRAGIGAPKVALAAHGTVHLQVTGKGGVPLSKVSAVVLNVTVTAPTAVGFATAFAGGLGRPTASNLNFVKAQTVPNLVLAPVGVDGTVDLYNGSTGTIQLIADVSGWFMGTPMVPGSISGTVTEDSGSHLVLANVAVEVCPSFIGADCGTALTAADGTYSITGLATSGDYVACFYADDGMAGSFATGGTSDKLGYADECYNNKANGSTPTPVPVTVGAATTGIDAALADAGAISGRVTDAGTTPQGLANVLVMVSSGSTWTAAGAQTSPDGTYSVIGLPAGADYEVCFDASGATGGPSTTGYIDQCFNNQPATGAPTPVAVTAKATSSGTNAALASNP